MKEYLYQRKVRYQSRPAFIALDILVAFMIIFSGPFIFVGPTFMMFMRIIALPHSQVQYLLPRTEQDIKKQSIMNVMMSCLGLGICMMLWLIPSLLLYNRLGSRIRRFPVFVILWIFIMGLAALRRGLNAERHNWAGEKEEDINLFSNMRQDVLGCITGFFSDFILTFLFGMNYCLGWMEIGEIGDWNYQSPVILILLIVTMMLILIDIDRQLKRWKIADYHEERENG